MWQQLGVGTQHGRGLLTAEPDQASGLPPRVSAVPSLPVCPSVPAYTFALGLRTETQQHGLAEKP